LDGSFNSPSIADFAKSPSACLKTSPTLLPPLLLPPLLLPPLLPPLLLLPELAPPPQAA
jgi:hypothetical protein